MYLVEGKLITYTLENVARAAHKGILLNSDAILFRHANRSARCH